MDIQKNQIALVASNMTISQVAETLVKEYGDILAVYYGQLEQGVAAARKAIANGSQIIVSRGGTALLIEKELNIHVTNIPLSAIDLFYSLEAAKRHGSRIALLSYSNNLESLQGYFDFTDFTLFSSAINDYREIKSNIVELKKNLGVDCFIGGQAVVTACRELGFAAEVLQCGVFSVRQALSTACNTCLQMNRFAENQQQFKAVAEYSSDGIILLDRDGHIQYMNEVANGIVLQGHESSSMSDGEILKNANLEKYVGSDTVSSNQYTSIHNVSVLLNYVPFLVNKQRTGSMISFQDITKIEALERQIRKVNYSKGLVSHYSFDDIVTRNEGMRALIERAKMTTKYDKTVLLMGETGTGKELFAQGIHR
jgi:transcriptional regulator with PAS, ATPase and Fis domain